MSTTRVEPPRRLEELSVSRAVRLGARGLTLRCPNCGGDSILDSWFRTRHRCGECGLRMDRGEQDFFLGGMMWNIVFAEGLLLVMGVGLGIATWPDVPWALMQWLGVALMVIAPFIFYPFSLGFWLACDILIRPVTAGELEWHRRSEPGEFRSFRDR